MPQQKKKRVGSVLKKISQPFVKWAGGKRSLIPEIEKLLPNDLNRYHEPFVGGGAVFFNLKDRILKAFLADTNEELIITYHIVKTQPEKLINLLQEHAKKHKHQGYYLKVRKSSPREALEIAARFIYLNKTCFNGLYRVNQRGQFNVPQGKYTNPDICNPERIYQASIALKNADIRIGSFVDACPVKGDFLYADPPYDECFSSYQAAGFGETEHIKLRDKALNWKKTGVKVMISNSDTKFIRKIYDPSDWKITEVSARRNINSDAKGRGPTRELIITSYE